MALATDQSRSRMQLTRSDDENLAYLGSSLMRPRIFFHGVVRPMSAISSSISL